MGRGAVRLRRAQGQRGSHRSRYHRVLPNADARFQDPKGRGVRGYPEDVDRENPEIPAARPGSLGKGDPVVESLSPFIASKAKRSRTFVTRISWIASSLRSSR